MKSVIALLLLALIGAGWVFPLWLLLYARKGRRPQRSGPATYVREARCRAAISVGTLRVRWPLGHLAVTEGAIAGWGPFAGTAVGQSAGEGLADARANHFWIRLADVREIRLLPRQAGVAVTDTTGRSLRLRGPHVVWTFERVYATASRLVV